MSINKIRCLVISDFNLDVFAGYLVNDGDLPIVETTAAPYGQVTHILLQEDHDIWKGDPEIAIIWTRPEGVLKSFHNLLSFQTVSVEEILHEVEQYASLLLKVGVRVQSVFHPTWLLPPYDRGFGMLNMKKNFGIANILMQMNLRLAEICELHSNIYLLDAQNWISRVGSNAFDPRLWYRGKIVFGNGVYKEAIKDIKAALNGIQGKSRKIIILDLDDTLWGGIIGDLGWEHIILGGHDPIGESYVDFQISLKSLTERGILLGLASKNDETTALEAVRNHPEMVLTLSDFAGWRINWQDKAQNIVDLLNDLNLGLQSAVFIDDNPAERARVRDALPEVLVPEWPTDSMFFSSALKSLTCFDMPSSSKEDRVRSRMYRDERQRKDLLKSLSSFDEWLKSLQIKITIEELNNANLPRTTQLLNKTNQMNLSTRRMTEKALLDWMNEGRHKLWTFRVSDKFGDSGLTGILSVEVKDDYCQIIDFILSCRVIGRKTEETMLFTVIKYASEMGLKYVKADYIPTPKNRPCLTFWQNSGFRIDKEGRTFIWDVTRKYNLPDQVEVINTAA